MIIRAARTRRLVTVAAATMATTAAAVGLPAASAHASILSPGKSITLKDSTLTARCSMSVQSIDTTASEETVKIGLAGQPTYLSGYLNNVWTMVSCALATPTGDPQNPDYLIGFTIDRNSATIPSTSNTVTIPITIPLELCAIAEVVLKNGSLDTLGPQCV